VSRHDDGPDVVGCHGAILLPHSFAVETESADGLSDAMASSFVHAVGLLQVDSTALKLM
jgi:hypothetical protein